MSVISLLTIIIVLNTVVPGQTYDNQRKITDNELEHKILETMKVMAKSEDTEDLNLKLKVLSTVIVLVVSLIIGGVVWLYYKYTIMVRSKCVGKELQMSPNCLDKINKELEYLKNQSLNQKILNDSHRRESDYLKHTVIPGIRCELQVEQELNEEQKTEINNLKSELNILKFKAIPDQQKLVDSQKTELYNLIFKTIPGEQKLIDLQNADLDNLKTKTIPSQQKLIDSQNTEINYLKSELNILKFKAIPGQQKALDSHKTELYNLIFKTIPGQQKLIDLQKADLDNLKTKTITSQQKLIDSQKTEINNLKSNPVPIGFIYVQLSGQSEPNTLWPNTQWKNISKKYSGLFFRAEGGQSSTFGKTQEQQTQSLEFYSSCDTDDYYHSEWVKVLDQQYENFLLTGGGFGGNSGIKFKHGNEEIRPRNQAVRIWQRTY